MAATLTRNAQNDVDLASSTSAYRGFSVDGANAWVLDAVGRDLDAYDRSGGTLTRNTADDVNLPSNSHAYEGLGVDGANAWVINNTINRLQAYDRSGGTLTRNTANDVLGLASPSGFSVQGPYAWVADGNQGILRAYDRSGGTLTRNTANDVSGITNLTDLGFSISAESAWLIDNANKTLLAYNVEGGTLTRSATDDVDLEDNIDYQGFSVDGDHAWIVDNTNKKLLAYEIAGIAPVFANDTGDAISGTVGQAIASVTVPEAVGPERTGNEQTVPIGDATSDFSTQDTLRWRPTTRPLIDAALSVSTAYLERVQSSGLTTVNYRFWTADSPTSAGTLAGPQMTDAWERNRSAIEIAAAGVSVVIEGPNVDLPADTTEPYSWTPDAEEAAINAAFYNSYVALTQVERDTTTLTLRDFVPGRDDLVPAPTYAVVGDLPGGLSFDATTRVLSGTPTAAGSGTITVRATNSEGNDDWTVDYAFAAAPAAPVFADDTGDAISGTVGTAIAAVAIPTATGNPNPAYFRIGAAPSGITVTLPTLGNDGSVSGTPTAAASGTIIVRATNSEGFDDWTVSYDFAAAGPALTLADLDDAGLLVDCKVLIEAGSPPAVWGIAPRTVSGTLVDGEFGLGSTDETATRLQFRDALFGSGGGGTHITINDDGALDLQAYFTDPQDGALNTLTIMNAAQETVAFSAGDTRAAGNPNFATFAVPAEHQAFVAAIAEGQRFIFRMARPEPTPTEFRARPSTGAPTVRPRFVSIDRSPIGLRALARTGAPSVTARLTASDAPTTEFRAQPSTGAPTVAATLTSTEASAPLTLDDLDDSGLLLDCKALIEAGEPPHLWRIRDGVIQGTLLDGDFVLGPDDIAVEWLRRRAGAFSGAAGGTHITLNDADTTKHLGNYFISPSDGALNTLTIMNEARETVSFSAGDTRVAGGDRFVTFAVPAEHQSFVAGIAEGQRFIFRMTRPGPTAIELRARPSTGAPTVRPRFVSIDRSPIGLRALARTGAPSVAARLVTAAVDVSNFRAQPSTGAPTVAATLTSIAAAAGPVTINTIPAVDGELVRMLITAGQAGAGSWYSRFTPPGSVTQQNIGSISADSDNIIVADPTPAETFDDVQLSVDRVQWTGDGNNRFRFNREPVTSPTQVSYGAWLTGDEGRNIITGLGDADGALRPEDPGNNFSVYLAFEDGTVHEVPLNTRFFNAGIHFLHVRLDDAAVRAAANAVAVDDLINLVIGTRSDLAPPVLPTEFRATPATGVPTVTPRLTLGPPPIVLRAEPATGAPTVTPRLTLGPPPIVLRASPRTGAPTVAAVLETLAVQVSELRAQPRTGAPSLRARLFAGTTTEMRALPATGPPRVRAALTSSGDRFITAYASIADVTEPDIFALFASAFAFTFNSSDEALPEHQDVIFRATVSSMHDPDDLVWSSQNEVGAVIPLRLPRKLLIAGGQEAQSLTYGSLTVDRPFDFPFPNAFGPGHVIQSLAHVGGANYMIVTSGASGHRLERFVVDADGTVSAQSTALMLAGGAADVFSISGADVNDDALILRNADGTISMRRYRGASNDVIDLAEAQLVDLQLLNAPHGMAHHDTQNILVIDNTANNVPALYHLQVTQNAVASIQALGTVTAMSGLTAQALTIDTLGEAVIAASDGRMWRVFYDLTAGFIGEAVAMTRPNGLISSVAGLAPLPQAPVPGVRWMNVADFGASQRVAVTVTDPDNDTDTVTISRLRAGSDAITVIPTNEAIVLPTSADGVVSSYLGAAGEVRVYRGLQRITEGLTFTRVAVSSNLSATVGGTTGAYEITNLATGADSANLVIRVTLGEFTIDKIITVTKARQGDRGSGVFARAIAGTVWSDTEADTATPGDNRIGDRVTLYNSASRFSETRAWDGTDWIEIFQIIDGNLIVNGTIIGDKVAAQTLMAAHIAAGSLTADRMVAGFINAFQLNADNIIAGTLAAQRIAAGSLTADKLVAGFLDAVQINADNITAGTLNALRLDLAGSSLSATLEGLRVAVGGLVNSMYGNSSISGNKLIADTITAREVVAGFIDAFQLNADNITAGTLAAQRIAAGSLTADKLVAGFLDAVQINADNITAGTLNALRLNLDGVSIDATSAGRLQVKDAGVGTAKIANNAVTDNARGNSSTVNNTTTNSTAITLTLDGAPGDLLVFARISYTLDGVDDAASGEGMRLTVLANGSTLGFTRLDQSRLGSISVSVGSRIFSSGTVTVQIQTRRSGQRSLLNQFTAASAVLIKR